MPSLRRVPFLKLLPFLILVILYILARVSVFNLDQDRIFPDTSSYALVADERLTSKAFWARERPFTVPLLYKTLGVTGEVYAIPARCILEDHRISAAAIGCELGLPCRRSCPFMLPTTS